MSFDAAFAKAPMPGISPGVYDAADFKAVSDLMYAEAGIVLPEGKSMLVYSRLAPLVRASSSDTFSAFLRHIQTDAVTRKKVIDSLTTNHTFFFRENHHFEHFATRVRPGMVAGLNNGLPVRIWSAGCSSGEETWSLTMTLLGKDRAEARRIASSNIRILASDLAAHAVNAAQAGVYPVEDVKDVPDDLRRNWMKQEGDTVSIGPEPRSIARFRELNLLGDWPMKLKFDVIFCRNVMIYFDMPTKERLVARFAEALRPGGYLYIGHSERVTGSAVELLEPSGPTIYRRRPS